jgi:hypothetical protein
MAVIGIFSKNSWIGLDRHFRSARRCNFALPQMFEAWKQVKCAFQEESSSGQKHGRLVCYRYTTGALKLARESSGPLFDITACFPGPHVGPRSERSNRGLTARAISC